MCRNKTIYLMPCPFQHLFSYVYIMIPLFLLTSLEKYPDYSSAYEIRQTNHLRQVEKKHLCLS
jgi:hypothetical protein